MRFFTPVPREKHHIDPIGDLSELKKVQLLLIDFQCYGNLTPRQRNKIMHHVQEIETHLKEKTNFVLKSEEARPIKLFPHQVRDNKAEYQRVKEKKLKRQAS